MEQKKDKRIIIATLILICLVIIIFLLIHYLGKIYIKPERPTGYVDIFDITFGNNKDSENDNSNKATYSNDNSADNSNVTGENSISGNAQNTSIISQNGSSTKLSQSGKGTIDSKEVIVYDDEKQYTHNTQLNIFTHKSYYTVNDLIAPGDKNSYQFVIRNNNYSSIKYSLEMFEENNYNINMKYRLKLNGEYVVGSDSTYCDVSQLNKYNMTLDSKKYDVYTLDWKWFDGDNDTKVGTSIDANYKLNLKIITQSN